MLKVIPRNTSPFPASRDPPPVKGTKPAVALGRLPVIFTVALAFPFLSRPTNPSVVLEASHAVVLSDHTSSTIIDILVSMATGLTVAVLTLGERGVKPTVTFHFGNGTEKSVAVGMVYTGIVKLGT